MNQNDSDLLFEIAPRLIDGTYRKTDLKKFIQLVDEGDRKAKELFSTILCEYEVDDTKGLEKNGSHKSEFAESLNSLIRLYKGDNFLIYVAKTICGIFYHLIATSIRKYSLAELFTITLYIEFKFFIGPCDFNAIVEKVAKLFRSGKVTINKRGYDLIPDFKVDNLNFEKFVLALCLQGLAITLKNDISYSTEKSIINIILTYKEELENLVKGWFISNDTFKSFEEIRLFTENEIKDTQIFSSIFLENKTIRLSDNKILNFNSYSFIDYSNDILGDGFKICQASRLVKEHEDVYSHKKEHDDYLMFLSKRRPAIFNYIISQIPYLSVSFIKENEFSYDGELLSLVGQCYLFGIVVERDFEKAYKCFNRASKMHIQEAAYMISVMYIKSLFVTFNVDKWLYYLALACKLGDENAVKQWKDLENNYVKLYGQWSAPGKIDLKKCASYRELSKIKIKFLQKTNVVISDYIACDPFYFEDIDIIFNKENNLKYAKTLDRLLRRNDLVKTINIETAQKIAENLFNMAKDENLKNSFNLQKYGPSCCWFFFAYSLGSKESLLRAAEPYGWRSVKRNEFSDQIIEQALLITHSHNLLFAYRPTSKTILQNLIDNGLEVANGFLIKIYFDEGNLKEAHNAFVRFMNSSTVHERFVLEEDIKNDYASSLSYNSNILPCLRGNSKYLRFSGNKNISSKSQIQYPKISKGTIVLFFFSGFFFILGIALTISLRDFSCLGFLGISAFFLIFGLIKIKRSKR